MTTKCFCYAPNETQPQFTLCSENITFDDLTSTVSGTVCVFNCGTYAICVNGVSLQDGSASTPVSPFTKTIIAPGTATCFPFSGAPISTCFLGGCVNADLAPSGTCAVAPGTGA